jgi:hypothetical protein
VTRATRTPPLLDADHAAFITSGVSIIAAAADADYVPSIERALGCKVSSDRRRVTVFLSLPSAHALLDDLRRSGRVAVVFTHPPTHRTIQLKGDDAATVALTAADRRTVAAYAETMVRVISPLGHADDVVRAMLACPPEELTAIAFTPAAAFVQTPGPRAGAPLAR